VVRGLVRAHLARGKGGEAVSIGGPSKAKSTCGSRVRFDSQWGAQVRTHTVARIRARIPPVRGLEKEERDDLDFRSGDEHER
jgi:hypothetical protein